MPELPEVEVIRRRIEPRLIRRRICQVRTTAASYFFLTAPSELAKRLVGRRAEALTRHGKYLVATLDDGSRLLLHLGMTGQLFTESARNIRLLHRGGALLPGQERSFVPDAHTHLVLAFDDGGEDVLFRDVRKFGKVRWLAAGENDARLTRLGPDALEITAATLFAQSRRRAVAVKTFLLDQSVLAGVGNIYADEALFRAALRPKRPAHRLSRADCERLVEGLRGVLLRSIETGGSSIDDYVQPDGSDGAYQLERKVYARAGEPCSACATIIERVVLGGRSTCYCPRCQR